jgi:glucose-1-phosphate cytidylyltransferase
MKVVILAGGHGTRLSGETHVVSKPLVEIGGRPILWHIMQIYAAHGLSDFVIGFGDKGHLIESDSLEFFHRPNDIMIDFEYTAIKVHRVATEPWRVTLADTGLQTMTGGRIKRVRRYLGGEPFYLTYGDRVGNVDLAALLRCHQEQGVHPSVPRQQPSGGDSGHWPK